MDISLVEELAVLARLELTQEQKEKFAQQLEDILEYFSMLQDVDTEGVEPISNPLDLRSVMRDDAVAEPMAIEDVLRNAYRAYERSFISPGVLPKNDG